MNHEKLLESLGEDFQVRENDKGFELYDTKRNLIASIKAKEGNITYFINKGFNKLGRMKRRMVLYELQRFCEEENRKSEGRYDKV